MTKLQRIYDEMESIIKESTGFTTRVCADFGEIEAIYYVQIPDASYATACKIGRMFARETNQKWDYMTNYEDWSERGIMLRFS